MAHARWLWFASLSACAGHAEATGYAPGESPEPPATVAPMLRIGGELEWDYVGGAVSVADPDGDGRAEILIGLPRDAYGTTEGRSAFEPGAWLVANPLADGAVSELGVAQYNASAGEGWGDVVALGPGRANVGRYDELAILPVGPATYGDADRIATLVAPVAAASACDGVGGEPIGLCTAWFTWETDHSLYGVDLYGPIAGEVGEEARSARLRTDTVSPVASEADFDGDGWPDLAVLTTASVALVSDPSGDADAENAAFARVNMVYPRSVVPGDVDGDGSLDLLVGSGELAPDVGGHGWLLHGPFAGDRAAVTAETHWVGTRDGQRLGEQSAFADFDGDGALDVALAGAHADGGHGRVHVWSDPTEGAHTSDDADVHLGTGSLFSDGFGSTVGTGDIDGDGTPDLVVGAPSETLDVKHAGAVYVVWGGGL